MAAISWRYISITLFDTQRPRRLTNSASSVSCRRCVAPPGRSEPRSKGRRCVRAVGMPSLSRAASSRRRRVCADKGQIRDPGGRCAKAMSTSSTRSEVSSLAAWWRAALRRVFGSCIRSRIYEWINSTSLGSTKLECVAWIASPMRSSAPKARA